VAADAKVKRGNTVCETGKTINTREQLDQNFDEDQTLIQIPRLRNELYCVEWDVKS